MTVKEMASRARLCGSNPDSSTQLYVLGQVTVLFLHSKVEIIIAAT